VWPSINDVTGVGCPDRAAQYWWARDWMCSGLPSSPPTARLRRLFSGSDLSVVRPRVLTIHEALAQVAGVLGSVLAGAMGSPGTGGCRSRTKTPPSTRRAHCTVGSAFCGDSWSEQLGRGTGCRLAPKNPWSPLIHPPCSSVSRGRRSGQQREPRSRPAAVAIPPRTQVT